jgi:hypothetical protein
MIDGQCQQRFAQGCAQATAGYAAAATAAYTNAATQLFDFWSTALEGFVETPEVDPDAAQDERANPPKAQLPDDEPAFGFSMADWCPFPWLDPRRMGGLASMDFSTPPVLAWMAMANGFPLRGTSTSWPVARAMIDSGVPRTVAWPTAEAHAAALDAADAASNGFRQVVASYHSQGGFAMAAQSMTPSVVATTMTVMMMNSGPGSTALGIGIDLAPWLALFSA